MGRCARDKPRKLGNRLKKICVDLLNLSQTEMAKPLALTINNNRARRELSDHQNRPKR
jgi:hypothetical protein